MGIAIENSGDRGAGEHIARVDAVNRLSQRAAAFAASPEYNKPARINGRLVVAVEGSTIHRVRRIAYLRRHEVSIVDHRRPGNPGDRWSGWRRCLSAASYQRQNDWR